MDLHSRNPRELEEQPGRDDEGCEERYAACSIAPEKVHEKKTEKADE